MYILIFCACIIHVWEGSRETGNQVTLWAVGTGQKENNRGRPPLHCQLRIFLFKTVNILLIQIIWSKLGYL